MPENQEELKNKWGPGNPEKGGDGTNGQDTPEIMAILKACRAILESKRNPVIQNPPDFEKGDLVYDSRTEEHGIVLGEMPDLETISSQISHKMTKRKDGETRRYIVLTITTDQENGEKRTRIRYVNRHNLRLIVEKDRNTLTDLDKFCSKQCIQECSSLCSLYKYKRVRTSEE